MQTPEQEGDEQMLVPAEQSSAAGGASGGPKTGEGKEAMRWNVTRHGISSPAPAVPNLEKREEWEEHRSGILHNLSPVGRLEVNLSERVALLSWRLHRVTRYETETIALSQQMIEGDIHDKNRILRSLPLQIPWGHRNQRNQRGDATRGVKPGEE